MRRAPGSRICKSNFLAQIIKNFSQRRKVFNLRNVAILAISIVMMSVGTPAVESASGAGVFHTVTFVENDNSSDSVFATQSSNAPTSLTQFDSLNPAFS